MGLAENSLRGRAFGIVVDGNPRLLQRQGHIGLRHSEDRNAGRWVLNQEIEQRIDRIFVPQLGNLGQALALERKQLGIRDRTDHDRLRAGDLLPLVVPVPRGREHIFADAIASGWIFQPFDQLCGTPIVSPRRDER